MSENLNEDLQKFEEIQAMLDGEEKGMHDDEKRRTRRVRLLFS